MIPDRHQGDAGSDDLNHSGALVAGDHRQAGPQVAVSDVQIGMAEAAASNRSSPSLSFAGSRSRSTTSSGPLTRRTAAAFVRTRCSWFPGSSCLMRTPRD
jgi:hypothetical protein